MPLQELQQKTTSTEFLEWIEYLKLEYAHKKPEHYYLAQIALEIRRTLNPKKKRKLDEFLLDFGESDRQANAESKMNRSKVAWLSSVMGSRKTNPPSKITKKK